MSAEKTVQNDFHDVIFFLTNHIRVHKNPELNTRVAREAYECACKRNWRKMLSLACSWRLEKFARDLESRSLMGNKRRL